MLLSIVREQVLTSLYKYLNDQYGISTDEIPYRLDTFFETLERTFGVRGVRTLVRAIARQLFFRYNLRFVEAKNYRLQDYLEDAKKELSCH